MRKRSSSGGGSRSCRCMRNGSIIVIIIVIIIVTIKSVCWLIIVSSGTRNGKSIIHYISNIGVVIQ